MADKESSNVATNIFAGATLIWGTSEEKERPGKTWAQQQIRIHSQPFD